MTGNGNQPSQRPLAERLAQAETEYAAAQSKVESLRMQMEEEMKQRGAGASTAADAQPVPEAADDAPEPALEADAGAPEPACEDAAGQVEPIEADFPAGFQPISGGAAPQATQEAAGPQPAQQVPPSPYQQPQPQQFYQPPYQASPQGSPYGQPGQQVPPYGQPGHPGQPGSTGYYQAPPQPAYGNPYATGPQMPPQPNVAPGGVPVGGVTKDHVAAGLLALFLGTLGVHKFYLGYNTAGFIMLAITVIGGLMCGIGIFAMCVVSIIEGVLYLTKSQSEFERTYLMQQRQWF